MPRHQDSVLMVWKLGAKVLQGLTRAPMPKA